MVRSVYCASRGTFALGYKDAIDLNGKYIQRSPLRSVSLRGSLVRKLARPAPTGAEHNDTWTSRLQCALRATETQKLAASFIGTDDSSTRSFSPHTGRAEQSLHALRLRSKSPSPVTETRQLKIALRSLRRRCRKRAGTADPKQGMRAPQHRRLEHSAGSRAQNGTPNPGMDPLVTCLAAGPMQNRAARAGRGWSNCRGGRARWTAVRTTRARFARLRSRAYVAAGTCE